MGAYFERNMSELPWMQFFTESGRLGCVRTGFSTRSKRYTRAVVPDTFDGDMGIYIRPRVRNTTGGCIFQYAVQSIAHILQQVAL